MFRRAWLLWSSIALFLLATGLEFALDHLAAGRPRPALAQIPGLLVVAAVIAVLVSAVLLTWRDRGVLRRLGVVGRHLLVLVGGVAGFLAPFDIFSSDPVHAASLPLPDGGTAYLYREGFFCSYTVWIAAPWSWQSQQQPGEYKCIDAPTLAWDPEHAQVLVLGPDGAPAPPPEPLRLGLGGPC